MNQREPTNASPAERTRRARNTRRGGCLSSEPQPAGRTVTVVVCGGAVSEVRGLPDGYAYAVHDLDDEASSSGEDGLNWECPACGRLNVGIGTTRVVCNACGHAYAAAGQTNHE